MRILKWKTLLLNATTIDEVIDFFGHSQLAKDIYAEAEITVTEHVD
jgi:hypothetical protein